MTQLIDIWSTAKGNEENTNQTIDPKEFTEMERMQDDQFINHNFWKIKVDENKLDDMMKEIE